MSKVKTSSRHEVGSDRLSGSNNSGYKATHHHKIHQKTSLLLALIVPFFLFGLIKALPAGYDGFISWIGSTFGAITLLAFITIGLFQSNHSINEVIMDYVPDKKKFARIVKLNAVICFVLWLLGVVAILRIWFGF